MSVLLPIVILPAAAFFELPGLGFLLAEMPPSLPWLPVGAALLLGLLLGGVFWRQRGPDRNSSASAALDARGRSDDADSDSGSDSGGAGSSIHAIAEVNAAVSEEIASQASGQQPAIGRTAANERRRLAAELSQAGARAERHSAESEAARARAATLGAQLAEQSERVRALTDTVERSLREGISPRQGAALGARAGLIRLAESVRAGRQWIGAAGDQLDSLHRRIEAAEERLWSTAEETAGFRQHLDEQLAGTSDAARRRRPNDARQRLHQRVVEVDEQMRVYHQHLSGCLSSVEEVRATLEPGREPLRRATEALAASEKRLAELSDRAGEDADDEQEFEDTLAETEDRLAVAGRCLGELDGPALERAGEVLERCQWVATEAPSGLLGAVKRFGDSDRVDDIGIAMMLSRSWRKISEVGGRLDNLRAVAESGEVGYYPAGAKPGELLAQFDKVDAAVARIGKAGAGLYSAAAASHLDETPAEEEIEKRPDPPLDRTTVVPPLAATTRIKGGATAAPPPDGATADADADVERKLTRELEKALAKLNRRERELGEMKERCEQLESEVEAAEDSAASLADSAPLPDVALSASGETSGVVRALRPGDFARHLVGLSAHLPDEPERLGDLKSAAGSFSEAQAALADLKKCATPQAGAGAGSTVSPGNGGAKESNGGGTGNGNGNGDGDHQAGEGAQPAADEPQVGDLKAAFEKTLLRRESEEQAKTGLPPLPPPDPPASGERSDLKRFEAASEHLLSAVAQKKLPATPAATIAENAGADAPAPVPAGDGAPRQDPDFESALVFCGNDPSLWGRTIYRGARHRALALEEVPDSVRFLRLRRLDTGEAVTVAVSRRELQASSDDSLPLKPCGFFAAAESFYGARHLGVYGEAAANDVETRFTYGGWGFGHGNKGGDAMRQCSGWAGLAIDPHTVFEITVFRDRPAPLEGEVFLDGKK